MNLSLPNAALWKFGFVAFLYLLVYTVPASVAAQKSDMDDVTMALDGEIARLENEAVAILFVDAAAKSDLEEMLSMTSPITRKQMGDDKIRKIYVHLEIPMFSASKVHLDACAKTPINDPDGVTGTFFSCPLNSKKYGQVTANITVLNEGDSYVSTVSFLLQSNKDLPSLIRAENPQAAKWLKD